MARAASPPDGLTLPGYVVQASPNHIANMAQTLKTQNGSLAGAVTACKVLIAASSDAVQARYLAVLQYLDNYGGGTLT